MNPFSLAKLKGMSWRRPEEKVGENQSVTKRPEIRQCTPTDITWLFSEYQGKAFCLWWIHMVGKKWCIPPFLTAMMMLSECEREADGSPHIDRPLLSLFHMMEWAKDETVLTITTVNHPFTSRCSFLNFTIQKYSMEVSVTIIDVVNWILKALKTLFVIQTRYKDNSFLFLFCFCFVLWCNCNNCNVITYVGFLLILKYTH